MLGINIYETINILLGKKSKFNTDNKASIKKVRRMQKKKDFTGFAEKRRQITELRDI